MRPEDVSGFLDEYDEHIDDETPVMICEQCGSPDVREVERVARSSETVAAESVSWRCVDCGAEQ